MTCAPISMVVLLQVYKCISHPNCLTKLKVEKKDGWYKMYMNNATHLEKPSVVYSGTTISGEFVPFVKQNMLKKRGAMAIHTELVAKFSGDKDVETRIPTEGDINSFIRSEKSKDLTMDTLWDALSWGNDSSRIVRTACDLEKITNLAKVLTLEVRE